MSAELRPCPFCGGQPVVRRGLTVSIWCHDCSFHITGEDRWNARFQLDEAQLSDGWIPCSERMPEIVGEGSISRDVLVCNDKQPGFLVAYWSNMRKCWRCCYQWEPLPNITHWRPLPQPPKGVEG